jgi:hypothetical protein
VPDQAGTYELRLQINNDASKTDDVIVNVSLPAADAGENQTIPLFYYLTDDPITLDATGSTGADSYEWDWDSVPSGSLASLSKRFTATPEFKPDVAGDYVVKLMINPGDGTKYEDETTVTITVQEVK